MTPDISPLVPYKNRRGWLIAFGVVEILIACFSVLFLLAVLFLPSAPTPTNLPQQSPMSVARMNVFLAVTYGSIAVVFLAIGVGSIRCKNWARIAMLVVSGFWLGAGMFSTLFMLLLFPSVMPRSGMSLETYHTVFVVMLVAIGFVMVVMPAVFLLFYSRKSVKATCLSLGKTQGAASFAAELPPSKVPVPVIVLAVWQGLGVFAMLSFIFVRAAVVFGVVLHGMPAFLVLFAHSALSGYAAWAIYRRKLLGWAIAMFSALFWTTSTITTFAGHGMAQLYREMGLSEQQLQAFRQVPLGQSFVWLCTLPMAGLLVFLLYTKKFFSRAATQAGSGS